VSESYVTTDGQSASLYWNKAPMWGLRPDFDYCQTVAGLLMWSAPSDERTGLSFTIAAGSSQRSHSRVRVPWDLRSYFTVSDSRLPLSSPPTTRRATVEVFDPASTPELLLAIDSQPPLAKPLHGPHRKHFLQQFVYCCLRVFFAAETCLPVRPWQRPYPPAPQFWL
jgi:hypothetical protein